MLASGWLDVAWVAFALANLVAMALAPEWETVPFHFIWVSLTLLYGFRVWGPSVTAAVLTAVVALTGGLLVYDVMRSAQLTDELTEVPLMGAMFLAMVWHAQRRRSAMATRLASAKPTQTRSSQRRRSGQPKRSVRGDSIPLTSHGRDRVGAQLGPEPAHIDVDHVGAGIEVVLPDRRQQPLLGDGIAVVLHELAQQQELAFGQRDRPGAAVGLPPDQIQPQAAGDQAGGGAAGGGPQPGPDPGQQLLEGERLGQIVLGPRLQAADLVAVAVRQDRTSTAWAGRLATSRPSTEAPSIPGMSRSRMTRS